MYTLNKYKEFCEMFTGQCFLLCPGLLYINHLIQFQSTSIEVEKRDHILMKVFRSWNEHTVYISDLLLIYFSVLKEY